MHSLLCYTALNTPDPRSPRKGAEKYVDAVPKNYTPWLEALALRVLTATLKPSDPSSPQATAPGWAGRAVCVGRAWH